MISTDEVRSNTGLDPVTTATGQQHEASLDRAKKELRRRRRQEATFTTPLQKTPEMKPFLSQFYKTVHTPAKKEFYRQERSVYKSVDEYYRKLCGRSVSFEDFWQRYEYRCNLERILEEQQRNTGDNAAAGDQKYSVSPTDVKEDGMFRDGNAAATDENNAVPPADGNSNTDENKLATKPLHDGGNTAVDSSSSEGSRANQAFKKRKSRLAKLVAAKKQLRKAQQQLKAKEQKEQEKSEPAAAADKALPSVKEENAQGEARSAQASIHEEKQDDAVMNDGNKSKTVFGVPRVDIEDVYKDENAEAGDGKKEKCECAACAIM